MSQNNELLCVIEPNGTVTAIYSDDAADLYAALGQPTITRASHVEPHPDGGWVADMAPSGGPVLLAADGKGFRLRQDALDAEKAWLERKLFNESDL